MPTRRTNFERENLSINQVLVNSISNEIIRYESLRFCEDRKKGFNEQNFLKALEEIPDVEPEEKDMLVNNKSATNDF